MAGIEKLAGSSSEPSGSSAEPAAGRWRRRPLVIGLGVLAAAALAAALFVRTGDNDTVARLAVLDPSVNVQPRAATGFAPASTGRSLSIGDAVRTDSRGRAQIDYAEGSLTRLDRDTTFVVEKLAASQRPDPLAVRVDLGRTWHEVADLTTSGERFQVGTSNAVATVRGTVFTVDCTPQQVCTFAVEQGLVEVVTRTGARILLRAGESVTVAPDGTLGPVQQVSFQELAVRDEWIRFNLQFRGPGTTTTTSRPTTTSSTTATTTSTTTTAAPTTTTTASTVPTTPASTVPTTAGTATTTGPATTAPASTAPVTSTTAPVPPGESAAAQPAAADAFDATEPATATTTSPQQSPDASTSTTTSTTTTTVAPPPEDDTTDPDPTTTLPPSTTTSTTTTLPPPTTTTTTTTLPPSTTTSTTSTTTTLPPSTTTTSTTTSTSTSTTTTTLPAPG